jgi:hypothetical protein
MRVGMRPDQEYLVNPTIPTCNPRCGVVKVVVKDEELAEK